MFDVRRGSLVVTLKWPQSSILIQQPTWEKNRLFKRNSLSSSFERLTMRENDQSLPNGTTNEDEEKTRGAPKSSRNSHCG